MKLKESLMIALMLGVLPLTVLSQDQHSDPVIFLGPESYIRHYLVNPLKPIYPESAIQAGIQGEVSVYIQFDKDGLFIEAKPLRPSPELLLESVITTLKKSRIRPPAPLYREAKYFSEIRFIFSLEDGKATVAEAPKNEQEEVSEAFNKIIKRLKQKGEGRQEEALPEVPNRNHCF